MVNSRGIPSQAMLAAFIEKETGLHYSEEKYPELERGLKAVSAELGFDSYYSFLQSIDLENPSRDLINLITRELTIGETYFFREPASFNALSNVVLPELIEKKGDDKRLRIWSAACCTGEEVYSIAISVLDFLGAEAKNWRIEILASDVNPDFLQAAQRGEYTSWSFRNTASPSQYEKWITKFDDIVRIKGILKKYIRFEKINLKTDVYPSLLNGTSSQDIIFCRNVFIYFNDELRTEIIRSFYNCLNEGGALFLGLTELPYMSDSRFRQRIFKDSIFFTRGSVLENPKKNQSSAAGKEKAPSKKPEPRVTVPPVNVTLQLKHEPGFSDIEDKFIMGDYKSVIEAFENALNTSPGIKFKPEFNRMRFLYVSSLANTGNLQKAADECARIIEFDKLNHISYFVYSKILLEQGLADKALEMLNKSLFLNQVYPAAYFLMFVIYKKLNKVSEAEKYYRIVKKMILDYDEDTIIDGLDGMTVRDINFILDAN